MTRLRSSLLSGSAWNLAGQALPLIVAVLAIPWLITLIGLERFGFMALAWVLVGYAGLFDLGIGRAVIRTVSARLAAGDTQGALDSGRAGLSFLALLGLTMGSLVWLAAEPLVQRVLVVPAALAQEALLATQLLALSLPFVMLTSGYVGVLSAHQAFKALNLVRASFSALSYLMPLGMALAGWVGLPAVVGAIVVLRVVGTVAFASTCRRHGDFTWRPAWPRRDISAELLSLGGWMSVSNLVGPLLTHVDRLLIGALVPVRSVGIYAAPYDLTSRLMVLPYAVVTAFFPRASSLEHGTVEAAQALKDLCRWLFVGMFPVLLAAMALAHPAMRLWLGDEIGPQAALVLQILVLGILCNTMAQGPATMIQAAGRPRDMALVHLAELPIFLLLLWLLTTRFGIVGTAVAATLRFAVDALAMFWLAQRGQAGRAAPGRPALLALVLALALLAAGWPCRSWAAGLAVAVLGGGLFLALAWWRLMKPHERARLQDFVARR